MLARTSLPLFLMLGTAASAATLPLKPGTYVLTGTPCHDPAFAAMFDYDGHHFSYPHATKCNSVVKSHAGKTYRISETCSALGDGMATKPDTTQATYTVLSSARVSVSRGAGTAASSYRWCAKTQTKRS